MVNIQSILHIIGSTVVSFDTVQAYNNYVNGLMDAQEDADIINRLHKATEKELAEKYSIPLSHLADVCFLFGTTSMTKQYMIDPYIRDLVCNPSHCVVIQIRSSDGMCEIIATIHREFDCENLMVTCPLSKPEGFPNSYKGLEL